MARKFGIITSVEGLTAGVVVESLSYSESAETAEARNETGAVTDLASYSRSTTLSISGLLDESEGVTLAKAGNKLTLDGKEYLIESVDKNESNTDFVRVSLSCRTADNVTIHIINEEA
jgi:hypothetical protein